MIQKPCKLLNWSLFRITRCSGRVHKVLIVRYWHGFYPRPTLRNPNASGEATTVNERTPSEAVVGAFEGGNVVKRRFLPGSSPSPVPLPSRERE